jgi:di/tricarboxylate transporter
MNDQLKRILKWGLSLGVGLLLYFVLNGVFDNNIRMFISITVSFILMVTFELLPTLLISMLLPCAYMLSNVADASVALSPWTNTLMYLVTAGMILSNVLADCGLLKRIALWFVAKCDGTFIKLVFGLYFVCLFMACISFCQAWLLMFTLAIALCQSMGYKQGDKEATVLMMAAFCGALTSTVYVYNPSYAPLLEAAYQLAGSYTFHWYDVYIYMLPYIPICLLFLWILLKAYKIHDMKIGGGAKFITEELNKMGPVTLNEKKAAFSLVFLVLYLVTSTWHHLNILYGFIMVVVYLFLPGINVGKREAVEKVNMGTVAFMVACMSIGTVAASIGFDSIIAEWLSSLLSNSGIYGILYTLFGLGAVGNFVMTPLAILTCLLNPVVKIALSLNINPMGAIYSLFASIDFYILPYENAWALVFFGLGMIKFKDFVKLNLLRSIMLTIALGLLFIPWWSLLGLI